MKRVWSHLAALLLASPAVATVANGATVAEPPHVVFPDDPCVIDAQRHLGANGDGKADDTAASATSSAWVLAGSSAGRRGGSWWTAAPRPS